MKISRYLSIVILICIGLALATADAQENLAQEVSAIFQQSCLNCHGPSGSFKEALLIDRTALIDTKSVIPGNPENSEFYQRLLGPTENGPQMPLNLPPLSPEVIETIARWITIGAPDWNVQRDINFITTDAILDTIRTHLESLDPFDRPSARYFTMTHLYNAGETPETLSDYQIALSKLINSLSWKFEITNPTPIDEAQTIFHIDLRRYEWDTTTDVWVLLEQAYPYNIAFDPETQGGLLEKLTQLQTETGSTVPFVHVDWFLATASLPPLYHDILDLPQTDGVLESQLAVNVASNIRNAPGIDVWRAGFNDSGVSTHNRVVERHTSRYGAYWKSYDFAGSVGSQSIFTHPLDFTHDGGEIIFNLPNGLQAYLLVDANGVRLDDAPIDIVSNPAASDPTVRNGLSCIGCHTQGMRKFEDSVRAVIEQDDNPPYNKAHALRLYPEQSVLDDLVEKDTLRFQEALAKIGGPFTDDASRQRFFKQHENEPIQRFHEAFQAPLDALHAAAAVGLETAEFLTQIREKQSLKNLGLQTLTDVNGTVKRDAWTSNFDDVISALNTSDSTLPPIVQRPEVIPGASVNIPDPNLRNAIVEALAKAPSAEITVTDMTTLTRLNAVGMEIQDLEGIQFATNLEELTLGTVSTSDLSPLAELINLKSIDVWQSSVSNLSPLTGLTKLERFRFSNSPISDLSPLAGLTSLTSLTLYNIGDRSSFDNSLDISPLAGLTELRHLDLHANRIADISPLKGLTKLQTLDLHRNRVSDISPLSGLVNLVSLDLSRMTFQKAIGNTLRGILSDISPLAGLTKLRSLKLYYNGITDISPLSDLINLVSLDLANNFKIADVSPLTNLQNLRELHLERNKISNVSPLANLQNLQELHIQKNDISDISPLNILREKTDSVFWYGNPAFPQGGPEIEGPWLWMLTPEADARNDADWLSQVSDGTVTELAIAANGAIEGSSVGEYAWTSHKIAPNKLDTFGSTGNIDVVLKAIDMQANRSQHNVVYGSVILYSPREQKTNMFAGSYGAHKVWLNSELVRDWNFRSPMDAWTWRHDFYIDYEDFFPVTLKQGRNVLLVAIYDPPHAPDFAGDFGFEPSTEYTTSIPSVGYTFSQDTIHVGDIFTLGLSVENVFDLAGWQFDIVFDPAVLEAVEVTEGDFLKAEEGATFFQSGTIDNTAGKITGINATRFSEEGVSGTGVLLSVTFSAKTEGETRLTLDNFQLGSVTGEVINAGPHEVVFTIEGQLVTGDVNRDGQVSVLDMILVSRHLGENASANPQADVNRDGIINIQDLIVVAQHLGESTAAAAPSVITAINNGELTPAMVQAWITQAHIEDDGSIAFRQGIATLEQLLTLFIPEETALLHNYPNPFNPETWIPYQLADPAEVTLTIYTVNGTLVRTLAVGHQPAGIYQTRTRAAYWDGKNEVGEPVASGVYFYTLIANDFSATRKMLIRK